MRNWFSKKNLPAIKSGNYFYNADTNTLHAGGKATIRIQENGNVVIEKIRPEFLGISVIDERAEPTQPGGFKVISDEGYATIFSNDKYTWEAEDDGDLAIRDAETNVYTGLFRRGTWISVVPVQVDPSLKVRYARNAMFGGGGTRDVPAGVVVDVT